MKIEDRIRKHTTFDNDTQCHIWTGAKTSGGYGTMTIDGKGKRVHRVVWEMVFGCIPEGILVRHKCNTPLCINPDHLELGTDQDNANDRVKSGRVGPTKGEANGNCKLSRNIVDEIRRLHDTGAFTQTELEIMFGTSPKYVSNIIRRKVWNDGEARDDEE